MNNENQLNFLFDMDYNDPNEYLLQNDQYMGMQNPYGNNNNRYLTASLRNRLLENKLTLSASFSCLRLSLLYLFYFIENYKLTPYLENLIVFLLVYEAMVIANFVAMKTYLMIKRMFNPLSLEFPTLCLYIYTFNEMILFTWFIYGCYCIMIDTKGVEQSLRVNPLMMYYITVLILFGFFIFSKAIFYLIFFICFCPCIAYAYVSDLYTDYERTRQAAKVQEELVEIDYEDYSKDKAKENIESTLYKNIANGQTKAGTFSLFLDGKETKIKVHNGAMIQLSREYQISTKTNLDMYVRAAAATTREVCSVKVGIRRDGDDMGAMVFMAESFCPSTKVFREVFLGYMQALDVAEQRQGDNLKEICNRDDKPRRKIGFVTSYSN